MLGPLNASAPTNLAAYAPVGIPGGTYTATLTGHLELDASYPNRLRLDPGGEGRNVDLPDPALFSGVEYDIMNLADAAETLTVRYDGNTVVAIAQNRKASVVSTGTGWVHTGVVTIALS